MPITPFHLGPALFFGLIFFRYVNFPAFLVSSVIVDIEPFLVIVFWLDYPLHGFFHSYLGGSIAALAVFFVMMKLNRSAQKRMDFFKLKQETSSRGIFIASFFGAYLHIFFDSFLYTDIRPFFPVDVNPLYGMVSYGDVILFCAVSFFGGILLYGLRYQNSSPVPKGYENTAIRKAL